MSYDFFWNAMKSNVVGEKQIDFRRAARAIAVPAILFANTTTALAGIVSNEFTSPCINITVLQPGSQQNICITVGNVYNSGTPIIMGSQKGPGKLTITGDFQFGGNARILPANVSGNLIENFGTLTNFGAIGSFNSFSFLAPPPVSLNNHGTYIQAGHRYDKFITLNNFGTFTGGVGYGEVFNNYGTFSGAGGGIKFYNSGTITNSRTNYFALSNVTDGTTILAGTLGSSFSQDDGGSVGLNDVSGNIEISGGVQRQVQLGSFEFLSNSFYAVGHFVNKGKTSLLSG